MRVVKFLVRVSKFLVRVSKNLGMACYLVLKNSIISSNVLHLKTANIPQYEMLFSDDPKNIMIIGNILRTKFKLLTDNQTNPSAHTTQLDTVTSSAATDSSIVVLQSVELE